MDVRKKVWGEEIVYIDEKEYVMKMLKIKKGFGTSLHYHPTKKETLYFLKGEANIQIKQNGCSKHKRFKKGEIITISPGIKHRISGITDVIIIEVSTQPKDDSVRI